jgi:hypothetical protein
MNEPATHKRKANANKAIATMKDVMKKTCREYQKKHSLKHDITSCFRPMGDFLNDFNAFITATDHVFYVFSYSFYIAGTEATKAVHVLDSLDKKFHSYDGKFGDVVIRIKKNLDSATGYLALRIKEKTK